jgi:hypothetical protein
MKIKDLLCENVEDIIVLQNIYAGQQKISATIRNQLRAVAKLKPKQFTTSYKNYLQIKNNVEQTKHEFNNLIDEYLVNINKLSLPAKATWLKDFASLKIL